jgi:hypothetical protein
VEPTLQTGPVVRDAAQIWRQQVIPVVFRDTAQKRLLVKLPYAADNWEWLRADQARRPKWLAASHCWQVPQAWLEDVTRRLCQRYGQGYLIHPYREHETCAPACWNAIGLACECSCLGAYHGQGQGKGWYVIAEVCAVRWGPRQYACRLLRAKGLPRVPSSRPQAAPERS